MTQWIILLLRAFNIRLFDFRFFSFNLAKMFWENRIVNRMNQCTHLPEDYIQKPMLESAHHDTLSCATIITNHFHGKGEEVMSTQLILNFESC